MAATRPSRTIVTDFDGTLTGVGGQQTWNDWATIVQAKGEGGTTPEIVDFGGWNADLPMAERIRALQETESFKEFVSHDNHQVSADAIRALADRINAGDQVIVNTNGTELFIRAMLDHAARENGIDPNLFAAESLPVLDRDMGGTKGQRLNAFADGDPNKFATPDNCHIYDDNGSRAGDKQPGWDDGMIGALAGVNYAELDPDIKDEVANGMDYAAALGDHPELVNSIVAITENGVNAKAGEFDWNGINEGLAKKSEQVAEHDARVALVALKAKLPEVDQQKFESQSNTDAEAIARVDAMETGDYFIRPSSQEGMVTVRIKTADDYTDLRFKINDDGTFQNTNKNTGAPIGDPVKSIKEAVMKRAFVAPDYKSVVRGAMEPLAMLGKDASPNDLARASMTLKDTMNMDGIDARTKVLLGKCSQSLAELAKSQNLSSDTPVEFKADMAELMTAVDMGVNVQQEAITGVFVAAGMPEPTAQVIPGTDYSNQAKNILSALGGDSVGQMDVAKACTDLTDVAKGIRAKAFQEMEEMEADVPDAEEMELADQIEACAGHMLKIAGGEEVNPAVFVADMNAAMDKLGVPADDRQAVIDAVVKANPVAVADQKAEAEAAEAAAAKAEAEAAAIKPGKGGASGLAGTTPERRAEAARVRRMSENWDGYTRQKYSAFVKAENPLRTFTNLDPNQQEQNKKASLSTAGNNEPLGPGFYQTQAISDRRTWSKTKAFFSAGQVSRIKSNAWAGVLDCTAQGAAKPVGLTMKNGVGAYAAAIDFVRQQTGSNVVTLDINLNIAEPLCKTKKPYVVKARIKNIENYLKACANANPPAQPKLPPAVLADLRAYAGSYKAAKSKEVRKLLAQVDKQYIEAAPEKFMQSVEATRAAIYNAETKANKVKQHEKLPEFEGNDAEKQKKFEDHLLKDKTFEGDTADADRKAALEEALKADAQGDQARYEELADLADTLSTDLKKYDELARTDPEAYAEILEAHLEAAEEIQKEMQDLEKRQELRDGVVEAGGYDPDLLEENNDKITEAKEGLMTTPEDGSDPTNKIDDLVAKLKEEVKEAKKDFDKDVENVSTPGGPK